MKPNQPDKPWYKKPIFWTAVAAAIGAVFDLSIGEQSLLVELALVITGGL